MTALCNDEVKAVKLDLGFVGMGNMGKAVLEAVLAQKLLPPASISVYDPSPLTREYCKSRSVRYCENNRELAENSTIIFLLIKPQIVSTVFAELHGCIGEKCVVSFLAGVPLKRLRDMAPQTHLIRVMPNTPMTIGCGASAMQNPGTEVPEAYIEFTKQVLSASGLCRELPEKDMDTVIGVNASGPAFFYRILHVMAKTARKQGMDYQTALQLAAKAMEGSAKMVLETNQTPQELIDMVTAPGGTTYSMLKALDENGFDNRIEEAMTACKKRAEELAR
jgi:pyrroline-5-carboxylate reductase